MNAPDAWTPPFTWEERLKYTLVPARLYRWQLLRRHLRHGDPELKLLPELVPEGRVAIDVGANKGVYTHLLARRCRAVHAFEPNPKMFHVLTRVPSLPPNVTAYPVALSREAGTAELIVPLHRGGFSNQHPSLHPGKRQQPHRVVRVETRTLDSYGFTDVAFLKIDVEGFEAAVLEGAVETLRRERPTVLIELEERHTGQPIEASLARMTALGLEGSFLRAGRLEPLSVFDPDRDHRQAVGRPGYVFNFIFRPAALARAQERS